MQIDWKQAASNVCTAAVIQYRWLRSNKHAHRLSALKANNYY